MGEPRAAAQHSAKPERAKKGRLVAIKQVHRDFHIGEGPVVWESWTIGCVWKTDRAGWITHVSISVDPPTSRPGDHGAASQYAAVLLIPESHEAAARYVDSMQFDKAWWPLFKSQETLAETIKTVQAQMDRGNLPEAA